MKAIAELVIRGEAEPTTAVNLFIRSVNNIFFSEEDSSVGLFMYPIYYGRFCAYLAACNLKFTAVQMGTRPGSPIRNSNTDELFAGYIQPILNE